MYGASLFIGFPAVAKEHVGNFPVRIKDAVDGKISSFFCSDLKEVSGKRVIFYNAGLTLGSQGFLPAVKIEAVVFIDCSPLTTAGKKEFSTTPVSGKIVVYNGPHGDHRTGFHKITPKTYRCSP